MSQRNSEHREVLKKFGKFNTNELQTFETFFESAGIELFIIYGQSTESGKPVTPYLVFKKNGKAIPIDLGIAGRCFGFIFPLPHAPSQNIETRRIEASKRIRQKDNLNSGELLVFNVDMFKEILSTLGISLLSEAMGISRQQLLQHNTYLRQYDRQLKLEYISNKPLLVFAELERGLTSILGVSERASCVGFIFREPNEPEQKFSVRKQYAEKKYSDLLNQKVFFEIYSSENFSSLFQNLPEKKQRVVTHRNSAEEEQRKKLQENVARFLNTRSGSNISVLEAKKVMQKRAGDYTLEVESKFPRVDIIFSGSKQNEFKIDYLDLIGWKYPLKEKKNAKPTELVTYHNVCGIVVVDDNLSTQDRKLLCRTALSQIKSYYPIDPSAVVMAVDNRLFAQWKKQNPIIVNNITENPVSNGNGNAIGTYGKRKTEYGIPPQVMKKIKPTEVGVNIYEPGGKSHIGGTQIKVVVKYGETHTQEIGLDSGWVFDLQPSWGGIGRSPSYTDGITPFLESGMWPLNTRVYRTDLLEQSFRPETITALQKLGTINRFTSANEFIGLELYHRLGREGFEALMKEPKTRELFLKMTRSGLLSENKFWKPLAKREQDLYNKKSMFLALLLSHAHQDHAIGSSLYRDEIIRGLSPITRAFLLADHQISSSWYVQDTAARKMREKPKKGASYEVFEYPYLLFQGNGAPVELAEGITASSFSVDHSIPGALAFLVNVFKDKEPIARVAYPGDYKNGKIFSELGKASDGHIDLLFAEGTNPPGSKKESVLYTEASVKEKFAQLIGEANQAGKLLIIDIVKNNFERLENIIKEANIKGRTVVISPRIVERCQTIELNQRTTHVSQRIKLPNFNLPNVKIWQRNMARHEPEHKTMFSQYGAVSQDTLSANPSQYVLIREGHEQPEKLNGISAPAIWVRSVYGDHDPEAREHTRYCESVARTKGWKLLRDAYHATGHGPILPANDPGASGGILDMMHLAHARKIAIIHTQQRQAILNAMLTYPGLRKSEIIWQINHPKYFGDPGHYIPLWTK